MQKKRKFKEAIGSREKFETEQLVGGTDMVKDSERRGTKQGETAAAAEQVFKYLFKESKDGKQYPNAMGGDFFEFCHDNEAVADEQANANKFEEIVAGVQALWGASRIHTV